MSIATRTGDLGETALMYGRRVSKTHPRVETYGAVDELNSALGMVRCTAKNLWVKEQVLLIQKDLVALMGELACDPQDMERYEKGGYPKIGEAELARIDEVVSHVEAQAPKFQGWATPGATLHAASLDIARTVCRRSEREAVRLGEMGAPVRPVIIRYLNRLSDALWLLARLEETEQKS